MPMNRLSKYWTCACAVILAITMVDVTAQPGPRDYSSRGNMPPGGPGFGGPVRMPPSGMGGPGGPGMGDFRRGIGSEAPGAPGGPSRPGPGYGSSQRFAGPPSSRNFNPPDRGEPGPPIPSTRFGALPGNGGFSAGGPQFAPSPRSHQGGPMPSGPEPADTSRMQQALRTRDYATIGKESAGVRTRTENIERIGPDMPLQDRIQLPLINHMYRQGATLMDEGRSQQDDSKIRMGIQQINQANDKLNRLKEGQDHAPAGRKDKRP